MSSDECSGRLLLVGAMENQSERGREKLKEDVCRHIEFSKVTLKETNCSTFDTTARGEIGSNIRAERHDVYIEEVK